jgi:hypothetical protein
MIESVWTDEQTDGQTGFLQEKKKADMGELCPTITGTTRWNKGCKNLWETAQQLNMTTDYQPP